MRSVMGTSPLPSAECKSCTEVCEFPSSGVYRGLPRSRRLVQLSGTMWRLMFRNRKAPGSVSVCTASSLTQPRSAGDALTERGSLCCPLQQGPRDPAAPEMGPAAPGGLRTHSGPLPAGGVSDISRGVGKGTARSPAGPAAAFRVGRGEPRARPGRSGRFCLAAARGRPQCLLRRPSGVCSEFEDHGGYHIPGFRV